MPFHQFSFDFWFQNVSRCPKTPIFHSLSSQLLIEIPSKSVVQWVSWSALFALFTRAQRQKDQRHLPNSHVFCFYGSRHECCQNIRFETPSLPFTVQKSLLSMCVLFGFFRFSRRKIDSLGSFPGDNMIMEMGMWVEGKCCFTLHFSVFWRLSSDTKNQNQKLGYFVLYHCNLR